MAEVNLRKGDWVRQADGSWAQVVSVDGHGAWLEGNLVTAHRTNAENVRVAGQIGLDGERWQPPDRSSREPVAQQEVKTAMNDVPEATDPNTGAARREEQARQRQRIDQLLRLTCMASERIPPDQRVNWGDLEKRLDDLIRVVERAGEVDPEAIDTGLRYGWVPAATRIRHERAQMVDKLSRTVEPIEERDRMELTERLYQLFPEDEIRNVCRGEGRTVEAVQDPDARSRLIGNFRNLHAEPVELPVPWRAAQSAISATVNPAARQLQLERSAAASRNMISASM